MIKLEFAHIEEIRGIRKLEIDFGGQTFAISGPNGSGKSGVIDAIEFALTGQIGRLTGRGTKTLSVSEHGPHIDAKQFPDAAHVTLRVRLAGVAKPVTITRKVKSPSKPKIVPPDADVKAILGEIAAHPEIALSRRDILRFILVEPTQRSEEIQAILKLDEIGQARSAFQAAQNKLQNEHRNLGDQAKSSRRMLETHLNIPTLGTDALLEAVNAKRRLLGLPEIENLTADTRLDEGLATTAKTAEFNKKSAQRDLKAFSDATDGFTGLGTSEVAAIITDLAELEADPALLSALQRRAFIEQGLEFIDGPDCPLCDKSWPDERHLREHLNAKLAKSERAKTLRDSLLRNSLILSGHSTRISGLLVPVHALAALQQRPDFADLLSGWKSNLDLLKSKLTSVEGLAAIKVRLTSDWLEVPPMLPENLKSLTKSVEDIPDQTATLDAQTFLTTAQLRLSDFRNSKRKTNAAEAAWAAAKNAYEIYCDVLKDELNKLYSQVQEDFSSFYRAINGDDESKFTAKLAPTEGRVEFDVDFYERGLFPPGAYHSEGHQDGMGVCLYLALMKRLFGDQFTFALLDDVVMSVDSGHRYQFCQLLKRNFPQTQFIITTHDRLWAEQMKSAGLITAKTSITFYGWTIESGPLVASGQEVWQEIAASLGKEKVSDAAATLRHHLEYVSRVLADQIGATPPFHADGNYELGELLPSVLSRMKALYGKAAESAQSWGKDDEKELIARRKESLSSCSGASNAEQWAINRAVHYNEWAKFGKRDFEPVVTAFKDLLECFRCASCEFWLYVTPRGAPDALRCGCAAINLNLKLKRK
jgi:hypothetical protein